jgi:hypothetical protein
MKYLRTVSVYAGIRNGDLPNAREELPLEKVIINPLQYEYSFKPMYSVDSFPEMQYSNYTVDHSLQSDSGKHVPHVITSERHVQLRLY